MKFRLINDRLFVVHGCNPVKIQTGAVLEGFSVCGPSGNCGPSGAIVFNLGLHSDPANMQSAVCIDNDFKNFFELET